MHNILFVFCLKEQKLKVLICFDEVGRFFAKSLINFISSLEKFSKSHRLQSRANGKSFR